MSLEKRLTAFSAIVAAKNLAPTKHLTYANDFLRLVLTRRLAELVISTLFIFGGQQFVIQNDFFSPVWPATGVALSAIFLRGYFLLLGIFFGTLASYIYNHAPWITGISHAFLFTFFIYLVRLLALHWIGPVTPIANRQIFWKFLLTITVLSALHIFIFQQYLYTPPLSSISPILSWYLSWLGEINGILCITFLCLIFDPFVPQRYFHKKAWQWWVLAAILIACHFLYYFIPSGLPSMLLAVFLLLCLTVYAKYFGQIPTSITLLGISVVYLGVFATLVDATLLLTLFSLSIIISMAIATPRTVYLNR